MKKPTPMSSQRLELLAQKAQHNLLSKEEKQEIVLGHLRLALQIANGFSRGREHLASELESEALLALVETVEQSLSKNQGHAQDVLAIIKQAIRYRLRDRIRKEKPVEALINQLIEPLPIVLEEEFDDICRDDLDRQILQRRLDGMNDAKIAEELAVSSSCIHQRRYAMRSEERR